MTVNPFQDTVIFCTYSSALQFVAKIPFVHYCSDQSVKQLNYYWNETLPSSQY